MKIVVIGDSHHNLESIKTIYNINKDADLFLDTGDSQLNESEIFPFISVRGNCDYLISNKERIVQLNGLKIFVTHGHNYLLTKEVLSQIAKINECNMIIHGHTHIPYSIKFDDIFIISPGSISRGRSSYGNTYVTVNYNNLNDIKINIIKIDSER